MADLNSHPRPEPAGRPGHPAIAYRSGNYDWFLQRMLSRVRTQTVVNQAKQRIRPLEHLDLRPKDNIVIGLLEAWATVGDVLTFYQERMANEAYLRTAVEPDSVENLLKLIAYDAHQQAAQKPEPAQTSPKIQRAAPSPGIGSTTFLAVTIADTPNTPDVVLVPAGTPVLSLPGQDQTPQTFETSEVLEARSAWNELKPYRPTIALPTHITPETSLVSLTGTSTRLTVGANLALADGSLNEDSGAEWILSVVKSVQSHQSEKYTDVTLEQSYASSSGELTNPQALAFRQKASLFGHNAAQWSKAPDRVKAQYSSRSGGVYRFDPETSGWNQSKNSGFPVRNVNKLDINALAADSRGNIFAGTSGDGIYRSTDDGNTWATVNTGLTKKSVNCLLVEDGGSSIYAGTSNGGVYRSTNQGGQWAAIRGGFAMGSNRTITKDTTVNKMPESAVHALASFTLTDSPVGSAIFAGTDSGVYYTHDQGNGWVPLNTGMPKINSATGAAAVVVNSFTQGHVEGFDPYLLAGTNQGVFRLKDDGKTTWTSINNGLTAKNVKAIVASPAESLFPFVFAATDSGIFRGTDFLDHEVWTPASVGLPSGEILSLTVNSHGELFAGTSQGVYCSTDNAESWTALSHGLPPDLPVLALAVSPDDETLAAMPFGGWKDTEWPDFHIKGNQIDLDSSNLTVLAGSWIVLKQPVPDAKDSATYEKTPIPAGIYQVEHTSVVPKADYGKQSNVTRVVVKTDDDLSTFDLRKTEALLRSDRLELSDHKVESMPLGLDTAGNLVTPASSIRQSTTAPAPNGAINVQGLIQGLEAGRPIIVSGKQMRAGLADMGGAFVLAGKTWTPTGLRNLSVRSLVADKSNRLFAATEKGVYVATSPFQDWAASADGMTTQDIRTLAINSTGEVFAGTDRGVFRSEDSGNTWAEFNDGLNATDIQAIAAVSSGNIFVGAKQGLFRSSGATAAWVSASNGLKSAVVRTMVEGKDGSLLVGTDQGVYRSTNHGAHWTPAIRGLDNIDAQAMTVDSQGVIFAGTKGGGVFRSTDGGDAWNPASTGLTNKNVQALTASPDGTIIAGTPGGGAFASSGPGFKWEPLELGVSNDVLALAVDAQSQMVAGTRNVALLTSIDGLDSTELSQKFLTTTPMEAASGLDQRTIPDALRIRLKEHSVTLTQKARVSVLERGARWLIVDGEDIYLMEATGGAQSGAISIYVQPLTLVVAASPDNTPQPDMRRWTFEDATGFTGTIVAGAGEINLLEASTSDPTISEVIYLAGSSINAEQGCTTLSHTGKLQALFDANSVTLSANVARATQGESVKNEVLGSGNNSAPHQRFALRKPPLIYEANPDGSGAKSTLSVKVLIEPPTTMILPGSMSLDDDNVQGTPWTEVPTLFNSGPNDRHYTVSTDMDGKAWVAFGDGVKGARLPTGLENIVATYRAGDVLKGDIPTGKITLLQRRPLGVRSINNPVPAAGSVARESTDAARSNSSLGIRGLDRIVSLSDYGDFVRMIPGVGKVQTKVLWNGRSHVVALSVAGSDGNLIPGDSALYATIGEAVSSFHTRHRRVLVESFVPRQFNVSASVILAPQADAESVRSSIVNVLKDEFSFQKRDFGQNLAASEVVAVIQDVQGVTAVDLNELHFMDSTPRLDQELAAVASSWDQANAQVRPAELVFINTHNGINVVVGA